MNLELYLKEKTKIFSGLLKYTHFGEVSENVDMRAEVADLTRNIVIRSEENPSLYEKIGGHIMVSFRCIKIVSMVFMCQFACLNTEICFFFILKWRVGDSFKAVSDTFSRLCFPHIILLIIPYSPPCLSLHIILFLLVHVNHNHFSIKDKDRRLTIIYMY